MILRDSIQDASTVKAIVEGLIRRADTYGKTREDILFELTCMVEDVDKSITHMDASISEAFAK